MNTRTLLVSTCAVALGGGALAHAQSRDLQELVVTANRTETRLDQVGVSVSVLDQQAIRQAQSTMATDLLVTTPGVAYSRNGAAGKTTLLNIRGAESEQTVVLIDGVKLNDPSATGGGYNSANLLSGDIARIEILRGAQSALWGSQAIGGVINIITRQPAKSLEADASVEGGSFNSLSARAGVGGKSDRGLWRVGAGYYTTDGVSAYALGRETDGYRNIGLNGRAQIQLGRDVAVEARAVYSKGHNEIDNTNSDAPTTGDTKELIGYGGLNAAFLDGRFRSRLSFAYTDTRRLNFNRLQANTPLTFDAAGQNRRLEYQGSLVIAPGFTARFGGEHERSRMRTASPTAAVPNPVPGVGRSGIDGVYGQLQAELGAGLTLTGGLRHDDHRTFGGHTVSQLAAAWSLNGGDTVLRASYGEGFKAPSLFQQYSEFGNLALAPEQAESWDLGVEQHLPGGVSLQATVFGRRTDNLIEFVSCTALPYADPHCVGRTGFYDNVGKARAEGVELGGRWAWRRLTASANYTWMEAKNATPGGTNLGRYLPRRPRQVANASVSYLWPLGLTTGAAVRHAGNNFNNAANSQPLKAYTLVDLRASFPIGDRIELFGRVENLFEQTYQTTLGYGTLGRGGYVGVRARY